MLYICFIVLYIMLYYTMLYNYLNHHTHHTRPTYIKFVLFYKKMMLFKKVIFQLFEKRLLYIGQVCGVWWWWVKSGCW